MVAKRSSFGSNAGRTVGRTTGRTVAGEEAGFADWLAPVGSRRERAIVAVAHAVFAWSEAGKDREPRSRRRTRRSATEVALNGKPIPELFVGFSPRELREITSMFTFLNVKAGTRLGEQGRPGREFIVVESGRVAVTVDGVAVAVLDEGCHFGALPLLDPLRAPLRIASFVALEPCSIAVANRREFWSLLAAFPLVEDRIRDLAHQRREYANRLQGPIVIDDEVLPSRSFPVHLGATVR